MIFFICSVPVSNIESCIYNNISKEDLEKYELHIIYTFPKFKQDIIEVLKILETSENHNIYNSIFTEYLKKITETDFINLLNKDLQKNNHKYKERNYIHKHFVSINNLCEKLKFTLLILKKLESKNIAHNFIKELILNKKYGILSRISDFFQQHYKMIFFINLIEILANGLNNDKNIASKQASTIFMNFFKNYLNINDVFHFKFLKSDVFFSYSDIDSMQKLDHYNQKYNQKCKILLECINESIFGAVQEAIDGKIEKPDNFFLDMFQNKNLFDLILNTILDEIFKIIKMCYPEEELVFINQYIGNIREKYLTSDEYFKSKLFLKDMLNGYFKYIALSSITSPIDYAEIFGKILFNLPLLNIVQSELNNSIETIDNLYSFIRINSDANIYQILQNFNKNKMIFIMGNIVEYRLKITFFKVFHLYRKYINRDLDGLIEFFYPKI